MSHNSDGARIKNIFSFLLTLLIMNESVANMYLH